MLTKKHLDQMRHAVGFFSDNPGFRNHYSTERDDPIWRELTHLGFAAGSERLGSYGFWVTEEGAALIGLEEQKRYKKGIDRYHDQNFIQFCEDHEISID